MLIEIDVWHGPLPKLQSKESISFKFFITGDAEVIGQILISLFEHNN